MLDAVGIQPLEIPLLPVLSHLDANNFLGLFFHANERGRIALSLDGISRTRKCYEGKNSFRICAFNMRICLLRWKAQSGYCTCTHSQLYSFTQHPLPLQFFVSLSSKYMRWGKKKGVSEWELSPSKDWLKTS